MLNFKTKINCFNLRKNLDIADVVKETIAFLRVVYTFFNRSVNGSFFVAIKNRSPPFYQFFKFKKIDRRKNG